MRPSESAPTPHRRADVDAPSIVNVLGNGAGSGWGGVYFKRMCRL